MEKKKGMKKSTYLIVWTIVFALILGIVGVGNGIALYWDSALTLFFGEVGGTQIDEGADGDSIYFKSDYASTEERTAAAGEISDRIAGEGAALLKNEGNTLPLASGAKVSIFGIAAKTSGIDRELEALGYSVNPTLQSFYANSSHNPGATSLSAGGGAEAGGWMIDEVPQSEYTSDVKASYARYNDAAIVLLHRTGAEGNDLPYDMSRYGGSADEHYLELNTAEKELFRAVSAEFDTVIVLIDSANAMQVDFVNNADYGIDAVLWYARPAQGLDAIAKIISGTINPSGRLVDTYVTDNLNVPAMQNFGDFRYVDASGELTGFSYMNYGEGIYVGYRYYETRYEDVILGRGNAGSYDYDSVVVFPFGYGLSYTEFEWSDLAISESGGTYTASVTVTNTGDRAGKDVVEFYVQSPYIEGGVEKSAVDLVEYAKTKELAPGESQTLTVSFTEADIAAYDYKEARTYVMDAGDYYVTAATDAHTAVNNVLKAKGYDVEGDTSLVHSFSLSERKLVNTSITGAEITNQLDYLALEDTVYLSRTDWSYADNNGLRYATGVARGVSNVGNASGDAPTHLATPELIEKLNAKGYEASGTTVSKSSFPAGSTWTYGAENGVELVDMIGLDYNDPKWDSILDEMKLSEMHAIFNKSGWGSAAVESIGKPKTYEYDAPNGIANFVTGEVLFSYPCATMLAATWNQELQEDYGNMIGNDAIASNTSGWYAPGINIHRTAFGARNYEYYSEDPVLTGLTSAAVTRGAEAKGIHVYLKHFAMNDQDTNRGANGLVATWATEQAAREIYLRPFQISIEKGGAQGIMLTMSRVGYRYSYGSYSTMTAICRNEWGFNGCYITDYTTTIKGDLADQYLASGGNLIHATAEQTLSDVKSDWSRAMLREAVHGILYNTANSLAMNGIEKGKGVGDGFAVYKIILIVVDAIALIAVGVGAFFVYSKAKMTEEEFQNRKRMSKSGKLIMWIVIGVILIAVIVVFIVWALPLLDKALKL